MVAQGDDIGSGVENELGLFGGKAHPVHILPVDHGEVDVVEAFQLPQMSVQKGEGAVAHHVAYGQKSKQHKKSSLFAKIDGSIIGHFFRKRKLQMCPLGKVVTKF